MIYSSARILKMQIVLFHNFIPISLIFLYNIILSHHICFVIVLRSERSPSCLTLCALINELSRDSMHFNWRFEQVITRPDDVYLTFERGYLVYLMSTVRCALSIQYSLALTFSNNRDVNARESKNAKHRVTPKYVQNNVERPSYDNRISDKMFVLLE